MKLRVEAFGAYELAEEMFAILIVEPALTGPTHTVLEESLRTTPVSQASLVKDVVGNPQRLFHASAGLFTFEFQGLIETEPNRAIPNEMPEDTPESWPANVLPYLLPSRYCESDKLVRLARGTIDQKLFGGAKVNAVADWVRQNVTYSYGVTDASTSAGDLILSRIGVCRDFAHTVAALCRALSVPARYVSGYCLGLEPQDFHAWVQVWLAGAWHNVDATFDDVRPALVPIAVGRDAADVSLLTTWGAANFKEQSVTVTEEK